MYVEGMKLAIITNKKKNKRWKGWKGREKRKGWEGWEGWDTSSGHCKLNKIWVVVHCMCSCLSVD